VNVAYVDSSCLVAIAFGEPEATRLSLRMRRLDRLFASNLLEAELRSALLREAVASPPDDLLSWITWVFPNRSLSPELRRVSQAGYLKGADLWHLAHALFLAPHAKELVFLTLDKQQAAVAKKLGFDL
jgi:predicted nucleic acid-binding protein